MATGGGDWLGLDGRIAVVTGAASGIGRAIAASLAKAGCRVALLDLNGLGAAKVANELKAAGAAAIAAQCDTTDPKGVAAARGLVERDLGPADILVNNAGIVKPGSLDTVSLDDWNEVMAVNLTGYLLCAQAFGVAMRQRRRGALVHTASIAGTQPQAHSGAYSVTKAGVRMLSRQLAYEWGPMGVRSNVVSPGLVRTALSEAFYQVPGVLERREALVPTRRICRPEDIADAATFLASDRAAHVTGDEIIVDGGLGQVLMAQVPRPGFEGKGNG